MAYITPTLLLLAGALGMVACFFAGSFWGFLICLLVAVLGWNEIDVTRIHEADMERFKR